MCILWARRGATTSWGRTPSTEPSTEMGLVTMAKTAVMGAGSWGTAFALVLADAGNEVRMWGRRAEVCEDINLNHQNSQYLADIELPDAVSATHDPAEAMADAEIVVLAVPSQQLRV